MNFFSNVKMIRDCSLDHADTFSKPLKTDNNILKKTIALFKEEERGSFEDIIYNNYIFVKEKRKMEVLEERKK